MVEPDTIKLLRECDAGIRMGISSIDGVLEYVDDAELEDALSECKDKHLELQNEVQKQLHKFHDSGKRPKAIAKCMSRIKIHLNLILDESDQTIADLMVDGCNMGVKSLCRYLNQYEAACEDAKSLAGRLIHVEEKLAKDIRCYL